MMTDETNEAPRPTPRSVPKTLSQLVVGYEVGEELGRGGMGVVFKARQVSLDRTVALKMILSGGMASEEDLARFRREARTLATLQHPHVVQIYDYGDADGLPWFALEFCVGGTLATRLKNGSLTFREAAEVVATLAEAVAAVHRKGIIHRDLKPGNVLFTGDGVLKVADFGLVRNADGAGTVTDSAMGTPAYMAPEQALGQKVDARADVYALGVILYECLAGRRPYQGPNANAVLAQVTTGAPIPPLRKEVPAGLVAVCNRCLERNQQRRCGSAGEMAAALRGWLAGEAEPEQRSRRGGKRGRLVAVALFLFLAVGVAAAWWLWDEGKRLALVANPTARRPTSTESEPTPLKSPFSAGQAKAAQEAWKQYLAENSVEKEVDISGAKLALVLIPPGTFLMGSADDEPDDPDENQHEVSIPRAFWLGKTEVTQAQFTAVTGKNPSWFRAGGKENVQGLNTDHFPVENVSWIDADAFCVAVSKQLGRRVTLPTEAQWEWACRAGTTTPFSFGEELNGTQANCDGQNPFGTVEKGGFLRRTAQVGSYPKHDNALGLADMHGNVWEWCRDWYAPYPAPTPKGGKDGPEAAEKTEGSDARVLRGGCWSRGGILCRSAVRLGLSPANHTGVMGFRVCLPLD